MRTKIEVKGVEKAFASERGRLQVIGSASFSVGEGEFVALRSQVCRLQGTPRGLHRVVIS